MPHTKEDVNLLSRNSPESQNMDCQCKQSSLVSSTLSMENTKRRTKWFKKKVASDDHRLDISNSQVLCTRITTFAFNRSLKPQMESLFQ